MSQGSVVSIHIVAGAPGEGAAPVSVDAAEAVAGKGLHGDRYYGMKPDSEVTLIEAEAVDSLRRDSGVDLAYGDARRNIVTRGVPLDDLVDREFNVGPVTLRGTRLSEPCEHLASLTDRRVLRGLVHRGGLKAVVVAGGTIRVGDGISVVETPSPHAGAPAG